MDKRRLRAAGRLVTRGGGFSTAGCDDHGALATRDRPVGAAKRSVDDAPHALALPSEGLTLLGDLAAQWEAAGTTRDEDCCPRAVICGRQTKATT